MTNTLLQTIETDLQGVEGWLETEAQAVATLAWTDFKLLFSAVTAQEYTNLKSIVARLAADEAADEGVEATVADVLTFAAQNQAAWVAQLPSEVLLALTALAKQALGGV